MPLLVLEVLQARGNISSTAGDPGAESSASSYVNSFTAACSKALLTGQCIPTVLKRTGVCFNQAR